MNEEDVLLARLIDLDKKADSGFYICYSDFLNQNELNSYHTNRNRFCCKTETFGGNESAERQIIAFIPDALVLSEKYPIVCLKILPKNLKFAQELSHRDILGAVMNLGIERKLIGDILVQEHCYYLFVIDRIAGFIQETLNQIKRTKVTLTECLMSEAETMVRTIEESCTIASNRLDVIVSALIRCSRKEADLLIRNEKVSLNQKVIVHNSVLCKQTDLLSVRGHGRFKILENADVTKKGKIKFSYLKYI